MSTLTQVPPLHQSTIETMACPYSYVLQQIHGVRLPDSLESDRGQDVHHIAAEYTAHCVRRKVPADWVKFDELAKGRGPEAAKILEGVRDTYAVEFNHVADTEWRFYLDEDFKPIYPASSFERPVWYSGTIDILLLFNQAQGGIDDWKTHPRPFEPPTPQSDEYAVAVFQHFPELQEIDFRYRFVRYGKCVREMKYTRKQLPHLMETLRQHKARQIIYHEQPEQAKALSGPHCTYCPALHNNTCPIPKELNAYSALRPSDRVRLAVYLKQQSTKNNAVLKDWVQANGGKESPGIPYFDGNGNEYIFGPKATESFAYPLVTVAPLLTDYADATPDDVEWIQKLLLSASKLRSSLKAKKRAMIDQRIHDEAAVKVTKVKTQLHSPDDDPNENEWEGE